jgi:type I restriction enzyme S subunit
LADADALIESLQQLIAKKRALKQGAMQVLLTGRQRLPGFSGEWKSKPLSELFRFSGGFSASRAQLGQDGHLYLHYGDIHGASSCRLDICTGASRIPRIEIPLASVSRDSMLEDGDVVFVDASEDEEGVCKHVVVSNPDGVPFIAGLHTIVAKGTGRELEHAYRRYCFHSEDVKQQFRFLAVGTKVQGVSKGNIGKIELRFPSSNEQTAIAGILSDMDAEIDALESRLAKTRELKAGMMQALLTGRIRLPLEQSA